jgi:hypothetical protein
MGWPIRTPEEKFLKFVEKTDKCWRWTGYTDRYGYGQFNLKVGKVLKAHRFSYELYNGTVTGS